MFRSSKQALDLPTDVLLSAREISRAAPRPDPEVPAWLKRVLPKSGLAGQLEGASRREFDEEEDPDDEDEDLPPRQKRNRTKHRLVFSTALHIDASVYVLDEGIPSDDQFGERLFALLELRKAEGAAIIQRAGLRVEDLARLCDKVLWF